MNNAERRLNEIEERLRRVEAPEPPASLIARIQAEIPAELGAAEDTPVPRRRGWYRLAASLAVLTVGGLLGYRLLREGPQPGTTLPVVEPRPQAPAAGTRGERQAAEPAPESLAEASGESPATARRDSEDAPQSDRDAAVQEVSRPEVESRTRPDALRESPAAATAVGGEMGARVEALDDVKAVLSAGPDRSAPEMPPSGPEGESHGLGDRRAAAPLATLSRSPKVPAVPPSVLEPTPAPTFEPGRLEDEVGRAAGAPSRTESRRELGTAGRPSGGPAAGAMAEPNDQPYGDMFFQGYGTNPFVDTEDDPLSTFGIDVDTASYTVARSYLERGSLPPAEAIRVEEFVNYFDYRDPAPRSHDFAVVAEGAPSPFASTARTYLLRFALKGREIVAAERRAAVLTFVVDVSGSMDRDDRLGLVKRALRLLVGELDGDDAIGLVVYGSSGRVILEPTSDHERVLAAIESLQPGGSTNAEEGLQLGYRTARRYFRRGAINRLILCSDGVANVGRTGPRSILDRIGREAAEGIELTTVGFGMGNYNDVLMEQLADRGDGNYAYVDDLAAARRIFVDNLTGTLETIAADARIQVEFDPRVVQSYRLLGYENRDIADRDFRNDAVDAGEIGAGHRVTALYEVKLRPDAAAGGELATLRLRYRSRSSGRVVEDAVALRRSDLAASWRDASHSLQLAAVAAEFAEALKGSYWARETSLDALAARARALAASGPWDSDQAELTELIERAARLRRGPEGRVEDGFED